ncbi:MAG: DUF192 domain-containing protein [Phycisphaerae bacterium]
MLRIGIVCVVLAAALIDCTPHADRSAENPAIGTPGGDAPTVEDPGMDVTTTPFTSPVGLPTGTVTIGDDVFHVEIAATPDTREHGLMERASLDADAGMLFVFDEPLVLSFWMLNTLIPLDIAFIRDDLTIARIDSMEPLSRELHSSGEPVRFALEVRAGEFARRGIEPGDTVELPVP